MTRAQDYLKTLRHQLGLSQSQFAKRFNLNFRTLQNWERGQGEPSGSVILQIQALLELEIREPPTYP